MTLLTYVLSDTVNSYCKLYEQYSIVYYDRDADNDYRLINGDFVDVNKNRFCKYSVRPKSDTLCTLKCTLIIGLAVFLQPR